MVITAVAPDPKCQLTVGGKPSGEKTSLNIGETLVEIVVGSIDGSTSKVRFYLPFYPTVFQVAC